MRVQKMSEGEMQESDKELKIIGKIGAKLKILSLVAEPILRLPVIYVILLCSTFVLGNKAYAIGYGMSEDTLLELQIARSAPTRIQIDGEKITDIFVHPQSAIEAVIHPSGCLVVLPQVGEEKVFITVFGENETVQDLSLRFTEKNPSPIRLIKFSLANDLHNQRSVDLVNAPNEKDHKFLVSNDQKTKENNRTNNKKIGKK